MDLKGSRSDSGLKNSLLIFQQTGDRFDGGVPSLFHILAQAVEFFESIPVHTFALHVFLEDRDVSAELVDAAVLSVGQVFADSLNVDGLLSGFTGLAAGLTNGIYRLQVPDWNAISIEVGARCLKVNIAAVLACSGDGIDGFSAKGDAIADLRLPCERKLISVRFVFGRHRLTRLRLVAAGARRAVGNQIFVGTDHRVAR